MSFIHPFQSGSEYVRNGLISINNSNTVGNIFTTGGNVGINTTAPSTTFTVNGTTLLGNVTLTNLISSNITTGSALVTGSVNAGSISVGTLVGSSLTSGSALVSGALNAGSISSGPIVGSSLTTGTLLSTSLTSGSALVTGALNAGSVSAGALVSSGLTTGNLNFTGSLFQNGSLYTPSSQWTTTSGNVSYTSGSVVSTIHSTGTLISTTLTSGSALVTGALNAGSISTGTVYVATGINVSQTGSISSGNIIVTYGLTAGSSMFTNTLYVNSTQNVGSNDVILLGNTTGGNNNAGIMDYNYVTMGSTNNSIGLGFFGANNKLIVQAGGNVGINTTNPSTNLHVSGGILSNTISSGSLIVTNITCGSINRTNWVSGDLIQTKCYNNNITAGGLTFNTGISSTFPSTVSNVSFTPKSSNSYISITWDGNWGYNGSGPDSIATAIRINGTSIVSKNIDWGSSISSDQIFRNNSISLIPITGMYYNTSGSSITITLVAGRISGDDTITFSNISFIIREIQF